MLARTPFPWLVIALVLWACCPRAAMAGMPSVQFSDMARVRLQDISFFLLGLLLTSAAIRGIWNWLQKDFVWLPRLSYPRACGVVTLWGLLFVVVLTMISGARELMTPGAWKRQGSTYQLADPPAGATEALPKALLDKRRSQLERLGDLLAAHAAAHDGLYPQGDAVKNLPAARWLLPEQGELHYVYVPDVKTTDGNLPLAYEPTADTGAVAVLLANGDVEFLEMAEVARRLDGRGQ